MLLTDTEKTKQNNKSADKNPYSKNVHHLLPWAVAEPEWVKRRRRKRLGKGLHREDWEGTMEIREDLPCCDEMRAVNLLFSEAIRLSSSFDVPSVCSRTFNSRISSRISSCVDIVSKFQDMTRIHWWSPICQMRKECSKNNYVSCYLKWNGYDQKLTTVAYIYKRHFSWESSMARTKVCVGKRAFLTLKSGYFWHGRINHVRI